MARETIELITCDICGEDSASPFVLVMGPKRGRSAGRTADLCEAHAAPLREAFEKGRRVSVTLETETLAPRRRRKPGPAKPTRKIYTDEELDALEQKESPGE